MRWGYTWLDEAYNIWSIDVGANVCAVLPLKVALGPALALGTGTTRGWTEPTAIWSKDAGVDICAVLPREVALGPVLALEAGPPSCEGVATRLPFPFCDAVNLGRESTEMLAGGDSIPSGISGKSRMAASKISSTEYVGEGWADARVRGETSRSRSSAAAVSTATLFSPSNSTSTASCSDVDARIAPLVCRSLTKPGVKVRVCRTRVDGATGRLGPRLDIVRCESLKVSARERKKGRRLGVGS